MFTLPVVATVAEFGGTSGIFVLVFTVSDGVLVGSCNGTLVVEPSRVVLTAFDVVGGEVDAGSLFVVVFDEAVRGRTGLLDGMLSARMLLFDDVDIVLSTVVSEISLPGVDPAGPVVVDSDLVVAGCRVLSCCFSVIVSFAVNSVVSALVTDVRVLRVRAFEIGVWSSVIGQVDL